MELATTGAFRLWGLLLVKFLENERLFFKAWQFVYIYCKKFLRLFILFSQFQHLVCSFVGFSLAHPSPEFPGGVFFFCRHFVKIISHVTATPLNTLDTEGMWPSDPSEAQVCSQAVMKAHPEGSVHYDQCFHIHPSVTSSLRRVAQPAASDLINASLDEAIRLKEIRNVIRSSPTSPTPTGEEQHVNGAQTLMQVCLSLPAVADVYL